MKKILVIGARCSSGAYIVNSHVDAGDFVVCTFRSGKQHDQINSQPNLVTFNFDLSTGEGLCALTQQSHNIGGFDLVYMIASAVPAKCLVPEEFYSVNVKGYIALLSAILLAKNALVIQMSSMSCFKPVSGELSLSGEREYNYHYPASKNIATMLLGDLVDTLGNSIRLCTFYIPALLSRGNKNNFFYNWRRSFLDKKNVKIFNPDAIFNACVDIQVVLDAALAFYSKGTGKNSEIFLCSQLTTLRKAFENLIYLGFYSINQIEIVENDRLATTLPLKGLTDLGLEPQSVSDILER